MDNLTKSAYPEISYEEIGMKGGIPAVAPYTKGGFTKHEKGAFMIAQGLVSNYNFKKDDDQEIIAELSYQIAETILNRFK